MDITKNYYEILGVSLLATSAEIKAAYRRLARQYHPDQNPDPNAHAIIQEINQAYEILSDIDKRGEYDTQRARLLEYAEIGREEALRSQQAAQPPTPEDTVSQQRAPDEPKVEETPSPEPQPEVEPVPSPEARSTPRPSVPPSSYTPYVKINPLLTKLNTARDPSPTGKETVFSNVFETLKKHASTAHDSKAAVILSSDEVSHELDRLNSLIGLTGIHGFDIKFNRDATVIAQPRSGVFSDDKNHTDQNRTRDAWEAWVHGKSITDITDVDLTRITPKEAERTERLQKKNVEEAYQAYKSTGISDKDARDAAEKLINARYSQGRAIRMQMIEELTANRGYANRPTSVKAYVEEMLSSQVNEKAMEQSITEYIEHQLQNTIPDEDLRTTLGNKVAQKYKKEFSDVLERSINRTNPSLIRAQNALFSYVGQKYFDGSSTLQDEVATIVSEEIADEDMVKDITAQIVGNLKQAPTFFRNVDIHFIEINKSANGDQIIEDYHLVTGGGKQTYMLRSQGAMVLTAEGAAREVERSSPIISDSQIDRAIQRDLLDPNSRVGEAYRNLLKQQHPALQNRRLLSPADVANYYRGESSARLRQAYRAQLSTEAERMHYFTKEVAANPLGYLTETPLGFSLLPVSMAIEAIPITRKLKEWTRQVQGEIEGKQWKQIQGMIYNPQKDLIEPAIRRAFLTLAPGFAGSGFLDKRDNYHLYYLRAPFWLSDVVVNAFGDGLLKMNRGKTHPNYMTRYFRKNRKRGKRVKMIPFLFQSLIVWPVRAIADRVWDAIPDNTRWGRSIKTFPDRIGFGSIRNGIADAWNYGGGWAGGVDQATFSLAANPSRASRFYMAKARGLLGEVATANPNLTRALVEFDTTNNAVKAIADIDSVLRPAGSVNLSNIISNGSQLRAYGFIADNFEDMYRFSARMSTEFPGIQNLLDDFKALRVMPDDALSTLKSSGFIRALEDANGLLSRAALAETAATNIFQRAIGRGLFELNSLRNTIFPTTGSLTKGTAAFVMGSGVGLVLGANPVAALAIGAGAGLTRSLGMTRGILTGAGLAFAVNPVVGIGAGVLVGAFDVARKQLFVEVHGRLIDRATTMHDIGGSTFTRVNIIEDSRGHIIGGQPTWISRGLSRFEDTGWAKGLKRMVRAVDVLPTTGGTISLVMLSLGVVNPILLIAPVAIDTAISGYRVARGWGAFQLSETSRLARVTGFFKTIGAAVPIVDDVIGLALTLSETGGIVGLIRAAFQDFGILSATEYLLKHGINLFVLGGATLTAVAFGTPGLVVFGLGLGVDQVLRWVSGGEYGIAELTIKPLWNTIWTNFNKMVNVDNILQTAAAGGAAILGLINVFISAARGDTVGIAFSLGLFLAGAGIMFSTLFRDPIIQAAQYTPSDIFTYNIEGGIFVLTPNNGVDKSVDVSGGTLQYEISIQLNENTQTSITITDEFSNLTAEQTGDINSSILHKSSSGDQPLKLEGGPITINGDQTYTYSVEVRDPTAVFANGQVCNNLSINATQAGNTQSESVSVCADDSGQVGGIAHGLQIECPECQCPYPANSSCTQSPWGTFSHSCHPDLAVDIGVTGPVKAPVDGVVRTTKRIICKSDKTYAGDQVIFEGDNEITYSFLHVVKGLPNGSRVTQGTPIAQVATPADISKGNCWKATNGVLHFTVQQGQNGQNHVDPYTHFEQACGLSYAACNKTTGEENGLKQSCRR